MCGKEKCCEQPDKLKTTPEECTDEQQCECHGEAAVKKEKEDHCGCGCKH